MDYSEELYRTGAANRAGSITTDNGWCLRLDQLCAALTSAGLVAQYSYSTADHELYLATYMYRAITIISLWACLAPL